MSVYILVHNTKDSDFCNTYSGEISQSSTTAGAAKAKYFSAVSALAKCCLSFITKVLLTKFITYTTSSNIQLNKGFRHNILKKSILSIIKTCKANSGGTCYVSFQTIMVSLRFGFALLNKGNI